MTKPKSTRYTSEQAAVVLQETILGMIADNILTACDYGRSEFEGGPRDQFANVKYFIEHYVIPAVEDHFHSLQVNLPAGVELALSTGHKDADGRSIRTVLSKC